MSSLKWLLSSSSSFHLQEVLVSRSDGPVAQPFGVVPGENELHGQKNQALNSGCLIGKALADAVADADAAVLQFDYADGDAVDIEHQIGPPLMIALERHLLGDGEVVLLRLLPVDQLDGLCGLAGIGLYLHAIAQQSVDGLVIGIEIAAIVVGLSAQLVESRADLLRRIPTFCQPSRQNLRPRHCCCRRGRSSRRDSDSPARRKQLDHAVPA